MENSFTHCQHCGALNFQHRKYCTNCSFRLPMVEKPVTNFYKDWNATVVQTILILVVLFAILTLSIVVIEVV